MQLLKLDDDEGLTTTGVVVAIGNLVLLLHNDRTIHAAESWQVSLCWGWPEALR